MKKIKKPIKATPKQKKLAKLVSENVGKQKPEPIGKLMREAGYSKSRSETPAPVIQSKGFIAILEAAGVTDDKIARKINEGIELPARHVNSPRFIDMSLKLKKHLNPLGDEAAEAFKTLTQIFLPERDKLPGEK